jgi:hypothetical protein
LSEKTRTETSAAKRLHAVLSSLSRYTQKQGTVVRLFDILPPVMMVTDSDQNRAALRALTLLQQMFEQVETEIEHSFSKSEDITFYRQSLPGLRAAITPLNFATNWDQSRAAISAQDLTGLLYTAQAIQNHLSEKELQKPEIDDVITSVKNAIEEIGHLEIDEECKALLIQTLDGILAALISYPIRGTQGLKEALISYIGALAFYSESMKQSQSSSKTTEWWSVISKVSDLIAIGQATWIGCQALLPAASEGIQRLLK